MEGLIKQVENQGCLRPSNVLGPTLWSLSGPDGYSEEGEQKR